MWLHAIGLSHYMTLRDEFRTYVRGYDPRAAFPYRTTIRRLAECTLELQKEARIRKIALKKKVYKGKRCIGLQLDMWWDSETQTAFAAVSMTTVEEPISASPTAQLWLESEVVDFEIFPYHSKTGDNIRLWLEAVTEKNSIDHEMVSGVCPDGAADGQCGLNLIESLRERVDTCHLHVLQRCVLFSIGLAGATSKNPEAKAHLKMHNRQVMLSRQSGLYLKSIKDMQMAAGVPDHKLLVPERTSTTRWGNQFVQVSKDNTLRPAIDPAIEKYKKENRGNKEAIVETNESDQGSKVGTAVAASELGFTSLDWEESQEMEAFLSYPYAIKETIEKRGHCTGAQGMALFHDLKENFCHPEAKLSIKPLPTGLTLADRERTNEMKDASDLSSMIDTARKVFKEEMQSRAFDLRPSNTRLVQCYMSKQISSSTYLSPAQNALAKTLYMQMLREAFEISNVARRPSSPRKAKQPKSEGLLFRGSAALPSDDSPAESLTPATTYDYDPVIDEANRWEHLAREHYETFISDDGLLNEFAMMWALRERFPLHTIIFKQTACHLPHEANVEMLFSRAGLLTDPNMDPHFLATLTSIAANKTACEPLWEKIKAKYFEKFRGKGGEGILEGEVVSSSGAGPSDLTQACASEGQIAFFAAIPRDHLALLATPSEALFTRTPSPTSPRSPWTYSSR